jgi:hypothetical protein
MRVLVCGGRDFTDTEQVADVLDGYLVGAHGELVIIQGGARGADQLARRWCEKHDVACVTVPARWAQDGRGAGPMRNRRMLEWFPPDSVVAFPGGKGTADMIRRAVVAGVPVFDLTDMARQP